MFFCKNGHKIIAPIILPYDNIATKTLVCWKCIINEKGGKS
jgi:hypothetical protein